MYLDSAKIMKYLDVKNITNESVTLKLDGEKLINDLYKDIHVDIKDNEGPVQELECMDAPFIHIYPNEIFNEKDCKQLAIELKNILNNRIKSQLEL